MVISGSSKHRYTQLEIQGRIQQFLNCRYTETRSGIVYSINYKNDGTVLATGLETPNRLSTDHYIFCEEQRRLLPDPSEQTSY